MFRKLESGYFLFTKYKNKKKREHITKYNKKTRLLITPDFPNLVLSDKRYSDGGYIHISTDKCRPHYVQVA